MMLAEGVDFQVGMALSDLPDANRARALDALHHPAGRGNMQVIRLSYQLTCISNRKHSGSSLNS
jgi:hypothetical protein